MFFYKSLCSRTVRILPVSESERVKDRVFVRVREKVRE
jgi:hypothetical protein